MTFDSDFRWFFRAKAATTKWTRRGVSRRPGKCSNGTGIPHWSIEYWDKAKNLYKKVSSQCVSKKLSAVWCYFVNHRARISSSDLNSADCAIDGVVSVLPPLGSHSISDNYFGRASQSQLNGGDRGLISADIWSATESEWTKSGRLPPPKLGKRWLRGAKTNRSSPSA